MTTPQRQSFSKSSCKPRIRNRTPQPSTVTVSLSGRDDLQIVHSIEGEPLDRMLQYIERMSAAPVRGLIRRAAIRQAGLVRTDEFRAPHQIYGWLAKLVRWGNFRRVPEALYYKLEHPKNFTSEFFGKPEDQRRAAWTTMFTGLLEAAMPLCRTPEERLFFQQTILDRLVAYLAFIQATSPTPQESSSPNV